jgi:hypothetical protein
LVFIVVPSSGYHEGPRKDSETKIETTSLSSSEVRLGQLESWLMLWRFDLVVQNKNILFQNLKITERFFAPNDAQRVTELAASVQKMTSPFQRTRVCADSEQFNNDKQRISRFEWQ